MSESIAPPFSIRRGNRFGPMLPPRTAAGFAAAILFALIIAAGFLTSRDFLAQQTEAWLQSGQAGFGHLARVESAAIFTRHSFGPVLCTEVPVESTATVTGMSCTSNS